MCHLCPSLTTRDQARCPVCKSSQWNTCPSVIYPPGAILFLPIYLDQLKDLIHIFNLQMLVRQILAFLGGLVGLGATIAATVSNEWRATSRASSVITATWVLQGLWYNCAGNAIGALHCRPHHTIFKLEGKKIQIIFHGRHCEDLSLLHLIDHEQLSWWYAVEIRRRTCLMWPQRTQTYSQV